MSLYYFVASLPTLSLSGPPPLATEVFLADAHRILGPAFAAQLEALLENRADGAANSFAARWQFAEAQLRGAVARTRAARLGLDVADYQNPQIPFNSAVERAAVEAFAKPNPLEREMALDRFRWSLLEDWVRAAPFSEAYVFAYALRLRMAHRWARLTDEAGYARLEETVGRVRATPAA